jgi:hypothetical protein
MCMWLRAGVGVVACEAVEQRERKQSHQYGTNFRHLSLVYDQSRLVSTRYQISGSCFVGSQTLWGGGHISWLLGRKVLLCICSGPWLC